MNDLSKNWPRTSLGQAQAQLTAPGMPFETVEAVIRGVTMRVWKNVPATAAEVFARAQAHGIAEFLVHQDERITYDGFARAVRTVAAMLAARGLRKGDRVALVMRNLPEWPVIFMGALLAGAIVVPLNAWWTGTELAYGILDSGARFVFADSERLARLKDLPPSVQEIFVTRGEGATRLEDIIGAAAAWRYLPDAPLPDISLSPENDATIFYTSGTSGAPKGALGTHRSLTTNIFAAPFLVARNALRRGHALEQKPRVTLLAVPFFHVIGSLSVLLPNMAGGGKLVLMPKFDVQEALALIERERVTITGGVPVVPLSLMAQSDGHDLSSLELITFGGAPSPASLAARVRDTLGAMPGQGWGMTETSATCTSHSAEEFLHRPGSCGPALPVSRLKIMKDGVETPPGTVGELWAFGPNIVKGYWNRPDATAETFADGWIKTGDIASLDAEGFCTIHDRAHDMVIRGGENIYCIEVENILSEHPAVADAALVGLPHPLLGEVPAALVHAIAPVSEEDLRAFAGARLAAFKVPVQMIIASSPLPRNAGGKLVKRDLRKVFAT
ncbi:MAG: long-chain fatty acid--CoA ligase [Alphaproteobacteria bacterium]|nr:long-chain fatty acid--CoA ligase [Alphaproteobacteria bacterium]